MKSFFRLRKKDKSAKFPYKFKSYKYFCSFKYTNKSDCGIKINNNIIEIQKLFKIKIPDECLSIIQDSKIKEILFKKENDNYYCILIYQQPEAIKIKNNNFISISKYSGKKLNRSSQNSGTLSRFKTFLKYKSENAGIDAHLINEAYTSQINCLTGKREFDSSLQNRSVSLRPDLTIDRDLNSAINIAKRWAHWLSQDSLHFEMNRMFVSC